VSSSRSTPLIASFLAASLVASSALSAGTRPSAPVTGEVLGNDLAGAIVHAATEDGANRTAPLDAHGRFDFPALSEGAWNLAVQTPAGLHVATTPVVVRGGESRAVLLTLAPGASTPANRAAKRARADKMSWWNNPLTATLIVVGAAVVVGVAVEQWTEDDSSSASPSTPASR
jgi:hypothetical protein